MKSILKSKIVGRFFMLGLIVGFLSACADMQARNSLGRLESSLADLRSFQAEQTAKISALDNDVRTLQGRLDEIEFQQNQRLGSALSNLKSDLSQLKRRVPPPIVPANELDQDEKALGDLPAELASPLNEGFTSLRDGDFERSRQLFEDSLGLAIGTDWAPMVLFWRGIALEGMNDTRGALQSYLEIAGKFPKYSRTPLVLLRQSSVLVRLGDKKGAKVVLNKVLADYPKSTEAQRAKERLKEM